MWGRRYFEMRFKTRWRVHRAERERKVAEEKALRQWWGFVKAGYIWAEGVERSGPYNQLEQMWNGSWNEGAKNGGVCVVSFLWIWEYWKNKRKKSKWREKVSHKTWVDNYKILIQISENRIAVNERLGFCNFFLLTHFIVLRECQESQLSGRSLLPLVLTRHSKVRWRRLSLVFSGFYWFFFCHHLNVN